MTKDQTDSYSSVGEKDKQLIDTQEIALNKKVQEKYIKFLRIILDMPVYFVDINYIDSFLKLHLADNEYDYLMSEFSFDDAKTELFKRIKRKLRHPIIKRELVYACNRMIYIGTDNKGNDEFLNFEECGNMFIHGTCGAGKTWFIYSIFKRLKSREFYKKVNIAFWSFKPFEFEGWCNDYLIKDPHDLIMKITGLEDNQSIVFVDEFDELMELVDKKDRDTLLEMFRNSKSRNLCFVCCSQHMDKALKEYGEYVPTRVCMMCHKKDESILMIGSDIASKIDKCGDMYVKNINVYSYANPRKLKVLKH